MSKVKIQGNASGTGTLTISAPNTNTDRTLTLPDADITLGGGVDGISSSATGTAITIDSSDNIGIGTSSPTNYAGYTNLAINNATNGGLIEIQNNGTTYGQIFTAGSTFNIRSSASSSALVFDTGGGNERMRIDSAGLVTKPYQPGFYARRSISGDGRSAGVQEWVVSGTGSYNTGGHFNASNGRFTAPVTGKYVFTAAPGYKQSSIDFSWKFAINGSQFSEPVRFIGGLNSHSLGTGTVVVSLSSGDYVTVEMGTTHHVNTTYNYFSGYLLG